MDPNFSGISFGTPWTTVNNIRTGPDGALWFTWEGAMGLSTGLGRITTAGVVSVFPAPAAWSQAYLGSLTAGGGFLWAAEGHDGHGYIGRWTVQGGLVQEYPITGLPQAVAWGSDGALWFSGETPSGFAVLGGYVGRLDLAGSVTTYPMPDASQGFLAKDMAPDADGNMWFNEGPGYNVGRVAMDGGITEYKVEGDPGNSAPLTARQDITAGPDGAMWLATSFSQTGIVRLPQQGPQQAFSVLGGTPNNLTVGSDGALWFTDAGSIGTPEFIGRMTTAGVIDEYPIPHDLATGYPSVITLGPDGNLWFGEQGLIVRLSPSGIPLVPPPPSPSPSPSPSGVAAVTTPPVPSTGAVEGWMESGWTRALGVALALIGALLVAYGRRRHHRVAPTTHGEAGPRQSDRDRYLP